MLALTVFDNPVPTEVFLEAADIFRDGRRRGIQIRSSIDCMIAAIALRHDLTIWHKDRNFNFISKIRPLTVTHSIL